MYTPIEIDKTRNLRYGFKALSLIEKKFGKSLSKIDFDDLKIDELIKITWAGLVHEDKELTEDKLMTLLDENNVSMQKLAEGIAEAMKRSFGNPNQAVANPKQKK